MIEEKPKGVLLMTAEQRRSRISARLHEAHQPISATALAKELGVSRTTLWRMSKRLEQQKEQQT